jgi:hypothetical protein
VRERAKEGIERKRMMSKGEGKKGPLSHEAAKATYES